MKRLFAILALLVWSTAAHAQGGMMPGPGTPAASATTTWNPADKGSNVTLSGGNLVATGGATNSGGRGLTSHSSGKYYFEFTATIFASNELNVGIANATWSVNAGNLYGGANSTCLRFNDAVYINFTSGGALAGTQGDTVGVAIDLTNKLMWVTKNGTTWSGSGTGTGNPSAGTLGFSFAAISGAAWFPAYVLDTATSNKITANFGGSAYAYTPPTGFGNW